MHGRAFLSALVALTLLSRPAAALNLRSEPEQGSLCGRSIDAIEVLKRELRVLEYTRDDYRDHNSGEVKSCFDSLMSSIMRQLKDAGEVARCATCPESCAYRLGAADHGRFTDCVSTSSRVRSYPGEHAADAGAEESAYFSDTSVLSELEESETRGDCAE